jgi:hypothetical protein
MRSECSGVIWFCDCDYSVWSDQDGGPDLAPSPVTVSWGDAFFPTEVRIERAVSRVSVGGAHWRFAVLDVVVGGSVSCDEVGAGFSGMGAL